MTKAHHIFHRIQPWPRLQGGGTQERIGGWGGAYYDDYDKFGSINIIEIIFLNNISCIYFSFHPFFVLPLSGMWGCEQLYTRFIAIFLPVSETLQ